MESGKVHRETFWYISAIGKYLWAVVLPLALICVFIAQNFAFNIWLNLAPKTYAAGFIAVNFALGAVLYGPSIAFKKVGRYVYLFCIALLVSFIFLSQFINFEYSQSFLQVSALRYIGQAFSVASTVKTFFSFKLLLFLSNVCLVIAAAIVAFWKKPREIIFSKYETIAFLLLIALIVFGGYDFLIRQEKKQWGDASRLYKDVYDLNTLVKKIGIVNFSLEDAFKYLVRSNLVTAEDKNFLIAWGKKQIPLKNNGKYFGISKGKNIIFVQIESLENSVLHQSINGQEITPNLNQLAKEGLYFSNYYTQVGPGNTADAEFSTLNSLYPLSDDVVFVDYAQNSYHALPQLLLRKGYHTYALHGDVPTFWNRSNIYPNLGYQTQFSESDYVKSRSIGKGPSDLGDEDFLLQSLQKMEHFKQPFFATLITISSHTPFELPEDLQTLEIPETTNLSYTQQQYLESIHYADKALGEFMDQLQRTNLYQNSLVVIYGDHGSFTNIGDALGTSDKMLPGLANSQVPLIILAPGTQLKGEVKIPGSHLDLFPTITNLAGVKTLEDMLGQDLLNAKDPVVTHRNIFSGTINTIVTSNLAFSANADGIYEHGTCLAMPEETSLPIASCHAVYDQQSDTTRASDVIIRGNLLNIFLASRSH